MKIICRLASEKKKTEQNVSHNFSISEINKTRLHHRDKISYCVSYALIKAVEHHLPLSR